MNELCFHRRYISLCMILRHATTLKVLEHSEKPGNSPEMNSIKNLSEYKEERYSYLTAVFKRIDVEASM